MHLCEACQTQHNGTYGSGRFCNSKCARRFSTQKKRTEINEKVKSTCKNKDLDHPRIVQKTCIMCDASFDVKWNKRHQKCCSNSCSNKQKWTNEEYVAQGLKNLDRIRKPWKSRDKVTRSFAERCVGQWLDELGIVYRPELPFEGYFIDFALEDKKIAIEVDGKQHEEEDRKARDTRKDELLTSQGWKVVRIKWRYLTKQFRTEVYSILHDIRDVA